MAHPHVPDPDYACPGSGSGPPPSLLTDPLGKTVDTGTQTSSYAALAPITRRSRSSKRGEHVSHTEKVAQACHVPLSLRLVALCPRLPFLLPVQK